MKKYAVIVAGGAGTRMNSSVPKQFLLLKGKPVLYYSINAFLNAYADCEIILVLPEEYVAAGQEIIDAFFDYNRIQITVGGRTRFHSVQNGLALISEENSIVFVHDAVRAMISKPLIERCCESVLETGSAVPVIDCKDSIRIITETGNEAGNRDLIKLVQTPQAFHGKIILPAYRIDYKDHYTDEAAVVEAFGLKVMLVAGDENNMKITSTADLAIAEQLLALSENN